MRRADDSTAVLVILVVSEKSLSCPRNQDHSACSSDPILHLVDSYHADSSPKYRGQGQAALSYDDIDDGTRLTVDSSHSIMPHVHSKQIQSNSNEPLFPESSLDIRWLLTQRPSLVPSAICPFCWS